MNEITILYKTNTPKTSLTRFPFILKNKSKLHQHYKHSKYKSFIEMSKKEQYYRSMLLYLHLYTQLFGLATLTILSITVHIFKSAELAMFLDR